MTNHHTCPVGTERKTAPSIGATSTIKSPFARAFTAVTIASTMSPVQTTAAASAARNFPSFLSPGIPGEGEGGVFSVDFSIA
jgi:hypothetical protein